LIPGIAMRFGSPQSAECNGTVWCLYGAEFPRRWSGGWLQCAQAAFAGSWIGLLYLPLTTLQYAFSVLLLTAGVRMVLVTCH